MGVSIDGGKTFTILGEKSKHIDNHVIWIDPANTEHLLVGCDGGLYESYDGADNWEYKPNLLLHNFTKQQQITLIHFTISMVGPRIISV
jgi:hypothetical protein